MPLHRRPLALASAIVLTAAAGVAAGDVTVGSATARVAAARPSTEGGRRVSNGEPVRQVARVKLPVPLTEPTSFDISSFDPVTQTYYLSDRTNGGVDAVNSRTDSFAGLVGGGSFSGTGVAATPAQKAACGPDGIQG